jgi:hypothetical protein
MGVSNERMKMKLWNRLIITDTWFRPQISRLIAHSYLHISHYTKSAVEKVSLNKPRRKEHKPSDKLNWVLCGDESGPDYKGCGKSLGNI